MKANTKTVYICEIIALMSVVSTIMMMGNSSYAVKMICVHALLGICLIILFQSFGFKKDNGYLKNTTIRTLISMLLSYMIVIYSLGIILGFSRGYGSFSESFFKNLLSTIFLIFEIECIRYLIAKNTLNTKKPIVIFTIISIILNVLLELNINNLITSEDKFIFLSTIIFPIIAEEMLCSYFTCKVSFVPSLIYKLVIKLYVFILPIIPNLGNYIYSFINVLFPYLIYMVVSKTIVKYDKIKENIGKYNSRVYSVPLILLFVLLVILVSGLFKYKLIAVASNSMSPTYKRGDAVIYEKVSSESIKEGEILVFVKDNKIITHRVIKKWTNNGTYYFNTKGDNNDSKDAFDIESKEILGKVVFKIKYIGYPTVLINEFFGKE